MEHTLTDPRRLLTPAELSERFGLKENTIRRWARDGRIPCVRLGSRTLRFDPDAVAAMIAKLSSGTAVSND
ncbi:MAG: helix-turn-helix domain-containing protein [Planctomycetes bacterium]|nr:helix-turn-helix domain-containing protein [Planctomycetota bacterium]